MNLTKTLPIAVLGLLALAACGSGDVEGTAVMVTSRSLAMARSPRLNVNAPTGPSSCRSTTRLRPR